MKHDWKICTIILAAGQGKRYGCPKIRAEIAGELFAQRIIGSLQQAGVADYAIVVSNTDYIFAAEQLDAEKLLINPDPQSDMLASVKIGLQHCSSCDGVIIWPVDFPLVRSETVKQLLDAFRANPDQIVKPLFSGRGGHPIILPKAIFSLILDDTDSLMLKEILQRSSIKIGCVPVEDDGVLDNLNYPA